MADVLIVGAGAAGLMAAGAAARLGHAVTVLEHTEKPAQKILVTGKGRCNLTNACDEEEIPAARPHQPPVFVFFAVRVPPGPDHGAVRVAGGGPQSGAGAAGVSRCRTRRPRCGRRLWPTLPARRSSRTGRPGCCSSRWKRPRPTGAKRQRRARPSAVWGSRALRARVTGADCVLVATGGLSYPVTGSTGDGYKLARQAGHTIVEPVPSLVSLVSPRPGLQKNDGPGAEKRQADPVRGRQSGVGRAGARCCSPTSASAGR